MTIQTAFRLHKSLVDKLKKYCEKEGRSQTWVANKAFNDYLDTPTDIVSVREKKPAASKAVAAVKPIDNEPADSIIDYLNVKAGTNFKHTESNRKIIISRLRDYNEQDAFLVIDKKCTEWLGSDMQKYLRPSTLFNATKFESYINERAPLTVKSTLTKHRTVAEDLTDTSWSK